MSLINNKQTISPTVLSSLDEHILVVKRSYLFPYGDWHGLKEVDFDHYLHIITHQQEFHPRSLMELDITRKQIIPYLIFEHNKSFFLMQRKADSSEARLSNKLTLGIGGHINKSDMEQDSIISWAMREFHEEVEYSGSLQIKPLGIINDDSNDVGKVHMGFVFLLSGDSSAITVKSELKSGRLVSFDECIAQKKLMETWSQFVVDHLSTVFLRSI